MSTLIELTGMTYGRWTVLARFGTDPGGQATWRCVCDCGTESTVPGRYLRNGGSRSCGCLLREVTGARRPTLRHGESRSGVYNVWRAMIQRYTNPNNRKWPHYGGRGITICDRWRRSFEAFRDDMGPRPEGLTLERINNDGNYEPSNCRWATYYDQNHNQRFNPRRWKATP